MEWGAVRSTGRENNLSIENRKRNAALSLGSPKNPATG
jgi:hypothetical protein